MSLRDTDLESSAFSIANATFFYAVLLSVAALSVRGLVSEAGHCIRLFDRCIGSFIPQYSPILDQIIPHAVTSASLPYRSFATSKSRRGLRKRQAYQGTGEYRIVFSREAITATTRATLWAVPVNTTDLRTLLQTAKADAANHSAHDRSTPFTSTTKGLRLVMTSIEKAQCPDSFNWEDYGTVSDVLLQSVVAESDSRNSIVGVVVDPTGKPLVDVIVLPAYVYINKYRTVDSSEPLQTLPRDVSPRDRHSQHDIAALDLASSEWTTRSRVEKRDKIRPVQGTDLTLHVRTVAAQTTAYALSVLASYAVNAIHCDSTLRRHQNFLSGYSIFETSKLLDTDFLGGVVFHLRSTAGPIKGHDMVEIVRSINQIIRKRSLDRDLDDRVPALVGKVVNAAGYAVAHWSVGIAVAAASSVCAEALVVNPDGTGALGYLTSYTDL